MGEKNHFFGKTHSEQTISIIKEKRKLQGCSNEIKKKMAESRKKYLKNINSEEKVKLYKGLDFTGKKHTEETKKKMSEMKKGKKRNVQKLKIYLSGPITGLTYDEATETWRTVAENYFSYWANEVETLSPMRGKEYQKVLVA
jgi:hypothetical protein